MGWNMRVDRWRAGCNLRYLVDPVMEWASEVTTELRISSRVIQKTPLCDLLMSPRDLFAADEYEYDNLYGHGRAGSDRLRDRLGVKPSSVILRENINYEVIVEDHHDAAHQMLVNYLVERAIDLKREYDRRQTARSEARVLDLARRPIAQRRRYLGPRAAGN